MEFSKVMGLDVGDKRIGIALSDPFKITAQGTETYQRRDEALDIAHIKELCEKNKVYEIVCGFPKNMDGTTGPQAKKIAGFAKRLEKGIGIPVVLEDERLTTVFAERILLEADMSRQKRRKVIDKLAAVGILQGYLDRTNPRKVF